MRKQYIGLALAGLLSLGLLSGCSKSRITVDDLMQDSKKALEEVTSANMKFEMAMDINVESSGYQFPLAMNMVMDGDMLTDPASMDMDMDISVSILGKEEKMNGQVYVVQEDGRPVTYSKTSEMSAWSKETNDDLNFEKIITPDFLDHFDKETLQLELTDEKINDQAVYLLTGKMKSDVLDEAMPEMGSDIMNSSGVFDDTTAAADYAIDSKVYLYKDSKLPAQITLDLQDGFDDLLTASMQSSVGSDASCTINEFLLTMTFNNYNEISEIKLPDEVLNTLAAPSMVRCSGIIDDLDTTVDISFDENEQLAGLEMKMTIDAGSESAAGQFASMESEFASAIGVEASTVSIEISGSEVDIIIDMDRQEMEASDLFGDVYLEDSKENIIQSMESDAGLFCLE